jgi:hypothetical protein
MTSQPIAVARLASHEVDGRPLFRHVVLLAHLTLIIFQLCYQIQIPNALQMRVKTIGFGPREFIPFPAKLS